MEGNTPAENNNPIDAVIAWVDGNDPALTKKRSIYVKKEDNSNIQRGALPTFFASNNEIRYCILSILKFAPFIRNIFIITDGQDPDLYSEIEKHFPGKSGSLKIIDHSEIFRGYEKHLPTFNSSSILSLIWRIEGLADNFVYFNDDFFIIRDIKPGEWFVNNRPVLLGKWLFPPYKKIFVNYVKTAINRRILNKPEYQPRLSFYLRQWKAAYMLGFRYRYFYHCHTPQALSRRRLEEFFSENGELLEKNISFRFRSKDQFLMTSLAHHLEILGGNSHLARLNLVYLHPIYSKNRLNRKIRHCENDPRIKYICAQSLDRIGTEIEEKIFNLMDRILDLHADK